MIVECIYKNQIIDIPDSGISNVISGRIKQTHGWRFEDGE